MIISEITKK